jgi:hypothetical protein
VQTLRFARPSVRSRIAVGHRCHSRIQHAPFAQGRAMNLRAVQLADLSDAHRFVLEVLVNARGFFKRDGHTPYSIAALLAMRRTHCLDDEEVYVDPKEVLAILRDLRNHGLAKQNPRDAEKWVKA